MIAYHLRQSFKPGEITPELANKIGCDLAMSLTKGKRAFIVCTHEDKEHIQETARAQKQHGLEMPPAESVFYFFATKKHLNSSKFF